MPERIDPSEIEASSSSHTENWVSSIRRMLGHGHRRNSEDNNVTNDDSFPITADPETVSHHRRKDPASDVLLSAVLFSLKT